MIIENTQVFGFEAAIRAMRNPLDSWSKSDSNIVRDINSSPLNTVHKNANIESFELGEADAKLSQNLTKAGSDHRKHLRLIRVWADLTLPRYVWQEADCYKHIDKISCSTMHSAHRNSYDFEDFEHNLDLLKCGNKPSFEVPIERIEEEWKDIKNYEGLYKISNMGTIYKYPHSTVYISGEERSYEEKILRPSISDNGYKKVILNKDKIKRNFNLHRLIAEHFIPNPDNKPEVNHIDGNKLNNNLSNLEWVTTSENALHAVDIGYREISGYTKYKVAQNVRKFNKEEIENIKQLHTDGVSKAKIAKQFGCHYSTIDNIIKGVTYSNIDLNEYDVWKLIISLLNTYRNKYIETKNYDYIIKLKNLLPESFLQKRTISTNYECLLSIYQQRNNHRLPQWQEICDWILDLPYFKELTGIGEEK